MAFPAFYPNGADFGIFHTKRSSDCPIVSEHVLISCAFHRHLAMGVRFLIRRARTVFSRMAADDAGSSPNDPAPVEEITFEESKEIPGSDCEVQQPEMSAEALQQGVSDIEAITQTWSKRTLILVFIK